METNCTVSHQTPVPSEALTSDLGFYLEARARRAQSKTIEQEEEEEEEDNMVGVKEVEKFTAFKARDGKKAAFDGVQGLLKLASGLLVQLPFAAVLTPLVVVSLVANKLASGGKKQSAAETPLAEPVEPAKDRTKREERKYDLVVFGATGFTGGLAAEYLAKQYSGNGSDLKWAIAGRKIKSLEKVRERLAKLNPEAAKLDLIIADTSDEQSVQRMVNSTRVVASTVGPFVKYGTPLVRACVAYGTDYCDITGEADWVKVLIEAYSKTARETGAHIVNFCGHDCIPWDLMTLELANNIRAANPDEDLESIEMYNDIFGSFSGGTLATIVHHLSNPMKPSKNLTFNALDMRADGTRTETRVRGDLMPVGYSSAHKSYYGFSFMSMVNRDCVRRSNALLQYGKQLRYKEQQELPGLGATVAFGIEGIMIVLLLGSGALRGAFLALGLLPKPGQGPSVQEQEDGFLIVTGYGKGTKGTKAVGKMYFSKDPGYRDTARMLMESALCMALSRTELPTKGQGGMYTPAAALGTVLRDRLIRSGTEFEVKLTK
ncbi:Saccharopine dehydrogenase-like oxidoreductase [Hondaea fermentalgiana]|uniref:Saccharopine dehydrogenase-like oxidoreductase n=1 Tax=Hondaea fermentalgiana TaxID=2315210 RepID=A0A2R5G839_9STRA|nr:Saccharopine dehydrogenase-like oxidoreductase [Hondaea fermentalgiana]|eukprot:GBG27226.1 Saccharopine dehydrogenase-like oxidoreductase [Hondaea fermentalgiana]